jgi:hypothetical protein
MSKSKRFFAVVVTVIGAGVMTFSLFAGIKHLAESSYKDIATFPVRLVQMSQQMYTAPLSLPAAKEYSLWLKTPNRQIQNQDFSIEAALIDVSGQQVAGLKKGFRGVSHRNGSRGWNYYRLGLFSLPSSFQGSTRYEMFGSWSAPFEAFLVIRQPVSVSFPRAIVFLFGAGIVVLVVGIRLCSL